MARVRTLHGVQPGAVRIERQRCLRDRQVLHHLRLLGFTLRGLRRLSRAVSCCASFSRRGLQVSNRVSIVAQLKTPLPPRPAPVVAAVEPQRLPELFKRLLRLALPPASIGPPAHAVPASGGIAGGGSQKHRLRLRVLSAAH